MFIFDSVFILKQVAAFPVALTVWRSGVWVLMGTGRGVPWDTGAHGTHCPPWRSSQLGARHKPDDGSYSPVKAGEQQFLSHRQEGCSVGANAHDNLVSKGRLTPAPCRGCSKAVCEQGPEGQQNANSSWMASAYQLQSTPVKIALSQATNDMAFTRVGHMPSFKDPLP